jgi:dTDP-4-dehydrorhamnose reductase
MNTGLSVYGGEQASLARPQSGRPKACTSSCALLGLRGDGNESSFVRSHARAAETEELRIISDQIGAPTSARTLAVGLVSLTYDLA